MANENNKKKESAAHSDQPLSVAEKKKLLAKLLRQERKNNDGAAPSSQEQVSAEPSAADEERGSKSAAQPADEGRGHDDPYAYRADPGAHHSGHATNNPFQFFGTGQNPFGNPMEIFEPWMQFWQSVYTGQTGTAPHNPAQQFFQYLSQYPHNGFGFQQNPFTNPIQNNAANPMGFFAPWMRSMSQNWAGGMGQLPHSGWSQMFQKTFAEQMQNAGMGGHHDAAQNPFLSLFTHGSQVQSGGFAKNGFLDPKAIFTHWSQQIPWEYFWTEIRKNKIFGINGMIPPAPRATFSSGGQRQKKERESAGAGKIPPSSPLIKMKESGSRNPFFCVHALLGSSFHFHFLANQMDKEQPFYALQAPGLGHGDDGAPLDDIEEFAALYIKSIRTIQKKGPYYLGGYSFGGWIAFEMARQLLKEGEEVGLVAVLGSSVPFSVLNPSLFEEIRLYDQFMEDYNTTIIHPFLPPEERKPLSYHKAKMNEKLTPLQKVMKAHTNAILSYLPYPCDAKVALFETLDLQLVSPYDYSRGWNRLTTREVDVHQITGNHLSMLEEPHINVLGEKLRHVLRKANGIE